MNKIANYYSTPTLIHLSRITALIEKSLREMLIRDDHLSYEYAGRTRELVFITGYSDEERSIPPFEHPMALDGVMNKKYIVVDLRKYVKQVNEKQMSLKDIITNYSAATFQINRAILLDMSLAEDSYKLQIVQDNLGIIFSNLMGTIINSTVKLNPRERVLVEMVCYDYVVYMFNKDLGKDSMREQCKTLLKKAKLTLTPTADMIDEVLTVSLTPESFLVCFENIKLILGEKAATLNIKVLFNNLSSFWFGPGAVETLMLAFEDTATMIALFMAAYNDASFKKSRLSTNIETVKRKIDKDSFSKLEAKIKEYSIYS